ncbi:uncharacterized protein F5147DRAFT_562557, partial [Suillus discolor]
MLKSARKHNVSFAPLKLSEKLKNQIPAWLHLGAPPRTYNKVKNKCLQTTHNAKSVKDHRDIAERLTNINTHSNINTCICPACIENRLVGCKNPNKCTHIAQQILDSLNPIFNPNTSPRKDNLTLIYRRLEKNVRMQIQPNGEILFDPSIMTKNHISECFRIFTILDHLVQIPAYRLRTPRTQLTVYTDGLCTNNGKQNAVCSGGIWAGENHQLNKAIKIPRDNHSNQIGELTTVLVALQLVNPLSPLKIIID